MFWRHPKEVDTARGERPSGANRAVKEEQSEIRGRSSATTTRVRTQPSWTPRDLSCATEPPSPRVHSSITPEEVYCWLVLLLIADSILQREEFSCS